MMKQKSVPFFNYPFVFTSEEEELLKIVRDVGRRGAFILQRDLEQFEQNLAAYVGARYAVGVANATDGLQLILMAAGIGAGDEVIFCSHTMVATAGSIHYAGAIPVPVEAGPDHLIDPAAVRAAITPKTRAIVPTQLNGRTADMAALREIADAHELLIFEDAAQALGSKFGGQAAGTFGKGACISFYPAKTLGCLGDGGAVITDDAGIYEQLLLLRDHGRSADGDVVCWGVNSRLDNLQASILDYRLQNYAAVVERRRDIARHYQQMLGSLEELVLPPGPDADSEHFDVYQNYEIEAERRNELHAYLSEHGVGTIVQWGGKAVHQFARLGFTQRLPFTERLFERMLMLPMNMSLSDDDIAYVAECIINFYQAGRHL